MLDDMARTRPTLDILPNLHTLEWLYDDIKCMDRAILFMHQRVRHLVISPLYNKVKSPFFVDACARMPHIHLLDLRGRHSVRLIEADVLEILRGLPELKKVIFPEFYLTSTLFSELSRKKRICAIKFEREAKQGLGDEKDVDSFAPVLQEGAFPALRELDITARLGDFVRMMNADYAPVNITSLCISTYVEQKPRELHSFLVTLSVHCRLLSTLRIKLLHVSGSLKPKLTSARQIAFDTLRPLFLFQKLTTFEVMHKYPINIALEEVEELARRWPSLENLYLNKEPLVMSDCTLDLRALVPFARHCPKLRCLGLFMDATAAKIHTTRELKPFSALEVLSVGTSQARDAGTVAAFLSFMCPPECKLDVDMTWTSHGGRSCHQLHDDLMLEIQNRSTPWKRVKDLLPLFIHLWREEREKSKALQREIECLRARNGLPIKPEVNFRVMPVNDSDSMVPRSRSHNKRMRKMLISLTKDDECIIS